MLPANLLAPSPIYQSLFRVPMFSPNARPGGDKDNKEPGSPPQPAAAIPFPALHPMYVQRAMESTLQNPFLPHPALGNAAGAEAFLRASLAMQQQQAQQQQQQQQHDKNNANDSPRSSPQPPPLKFGISAILSGDGNGSPSTKTGKRQRD